jgi:phage-related minor tail protein
MGEAGPEAIMPLKRGPDGRLGVAGSGGGAVHIVNNTQGRVDRVTEQTTPDGDRVLILDETIERLLANPNSKASRAFSRHTTAGRKR